MKLNLGCGMNKMPGWHNVDSAPHSEPDTLWNLEKAPWPWLDSSVEEMLFNHSLEHMGQDTKTFLAIIQEIYRVARPGALIRINVPHPRHDNYLHDPTHVRPVTPEMLAMFDKRKNEEWVRAKAANTPLGLYLDVDLEITDVVMTVDEPYLSKLKSGELKPEALAVLARERNNVISECRIQMRARKG
jgi:predicted SAM-dependent methyltransferase